MDIGTEEDLNTFLPVSTYTRIRIVQQLLPLLTSAKSLARVLDVAAGTYEGAIDTSDISAFTMPLWKLRSHMAIMHTFAWEVLADQAPGVSLVHNFPGSVRRICTRDGFAQECRGGDWMDSQYC
jgi:hypothetical protein